VSVGDGEAAESRVLDVDHVVVCAGQVSVRSLYDELLAARARRAEGETGTADADHAPEVFLVGGADVAAELDAKRAIEQGTRVAATL
jgi:2,4-dienoyl-CoA reductase (NADPH2)